MGVPDVMVVPLSKKVSLGLPITEGTVVPAIGPPSPTKRKKSRKTPLGNWADEIKDKGEKDLGLDREVHKHAMAINRNQTDTRQIEVKKRGRNKKKENDQKSNDKKDDQKSKNKIASIKDRIEQLEKQAELSDSNLDLSELSDCGMMESV